MRAHGGNRPRRRDEFVRLAGAPKKMLQVARLPKTEVSEPFSKKDMFAGADANPRSDVAKPRGNDPKFEDMTNTPRKDDPLAASAPHSRDG